MQPACPGCTGPLINASVCPSVRSSVRRRLAAPSPPLISSSSSSCLHPARRTQRGRTKMKGRGGGGGEGRRGLVGGGGGVGGGGAGGAHGFRDRRRGAAAAAVGLRAREPRTDGRLRCLIYGSSPPPPPPPPPGDQTRLLLLCHSLPLHESWPNKRAFLFHFPAGELVLNRVRFGGFFQAASRMMGWMESVLPGWG